MSRDMAEPIGNGAHQLLGEDNQSDCLSLRQPSVSIRERFEEGNILI